MANKNGVNIPIGVTLDLSEVTKDAQTMSDKISDALSKHKDTQNPQIANAIKNLEKLQDKIIAIEAAREKMTSGSDNYQKLKELEERWTRTYEKTKQAEEAYKDYLTSIGKGNLVKNFDKYTASGIDKAYFGKNRTAEITEYIEKLKELSKASSEARREMLSVQGKAWNAAPNALTEEEMRQLAVLYKDATDSAGVYLLKVNEVEAKTQELGRETGKTGNSFKSNFYFARTILNDVRRSIQRTTSQLKSFASGIGNVAKRLTHLGSESKGLIGNLTKGFKNALRNLMRYGLGVRSLYFLFRRLRGYAKEALQEMTKAFPEVNQQVSRAVTALNQMKASIGTAVQPLLNVLVPALEKVAALIEKIANLIGSFFALLTGQKTIYRAVAVETDYAASLESTGSAAKKAKKELEGYLSPIDEINKYNSNKDNDSGGGAGGGGLAYEEVPIDPEILDLFAKLREMWEKGDFYDLGREIGEKLRDALEAIPWDEIRETANKLGKSVATLINGFIEVERLAYDIGTTIAQGVNTVFEFVNGFVHNIHWASIGTFIADTFNGFFENIDWNLIKDTIETGFIGLATSINQFVQDFHWENISEFISNAVNTITTGIADFFDTVNWDELATKLGEQLKNTIQKIDTRKLGEAIGGIVHAAATVASGLLAGLDWNTVKQKVRLMIEGFFSKLTEADKSLIQNTIMNLIIFVVSKAVLAAIAPLIAKALGEKILGAIFGAGGASAAGTAAGTAWGASFSSGALGAVLGFGLGAAIGSAIMSELLPELLHWQDEVADFFGWWDKNSLQTIDTNDRMIRAYGSSWSGPLKLLKESAQDALSVFTGEDFKYSFEELESSITLDQWILDSSVDAYKDYVSQINVLSTDSTDVIHKNTLSKQEYTKLYTQFMGKEAKSREDISKKEIEFQKLLTQAQKDGATSYNDFVQAVNSSLGSYETSMESAKNETVALQNTVKDSNKAVKDSTKSMSVEVSTEYVGLETKQASAINHMVGEQETLVKGSNSMKTRIGEILENMKKFFTADKWNLTGVKEGLTNTFNSAVEAIKGIWNRFADWLNSKLTIDIDTSGMFGSKVASFLGTSHLNLGRIPKLAEGAVLPPNREFMAVLGDQKQGTNIETPLDTMIEAFNAALSKNGGGRTEINFLLPDRRKIAQYVLEGGRIMQTSTGKNPFELA